MTTGNKVLAVMQAIAETLEISPKGQPMQIDPTKLEESLSKVEIKQIFQKLADEQGVVELLRTPYSFDVVIGEDQDVYKFNLTDIGKFQKYLDELKRKSSDKQADTRTPMFRFNQGVLFRDFCDTILKIGGENTFEYRLIQTALRTPVGEKIDTLTDELEMDWRQLYDTAKRLNDKIKSTFKIADFFMIDYQNKNIKKTIE
ncbi:MAG: hypothetical protein HY453_01230 [Parcubacteria group bacterium]|nr:hypothetical protein [Parcubacteria group bacterium]